MDRVDLVLDGRRYVEKSANKYMTADTLAEIKRRNIIQIQRIWRAHMAKSKARRIREHNERFDEEQQEERCLCALRH
jgi:hypothetical protein